MSVQIRIQADDFFEAYRVLKANYSNASPTVMGPSVVCLAFAVELYLKDLHFIHKGKVPHGHDIYKLFEKLPPETKQQIFTHKSISQNPFMLRGDVVSTKYFDPGYSAYDRFIDQMKAISDGFEKWRYSYESITLKYESFFAIALIEAVVSIGDKIRRQKQTKMRDLKRRNG